MCQCVPAPKGRNIGTFFIIAFVVCVAWRIAAGGLDYTLFISLQEQIPTDNHEFSDCRSGQHRAGICKETGDEPDHAGIQDVRAAFETLDEEERMILAFSVFAGYQSEEIGRMLECSPGTVRSKKSRALGKLRRILENAG